MSANLELKKQQVQDIKSKIEKASSVVFVDYRGINVADDTNLRNQMREKGCEYHVYKNRIVKLALGELGIDLGDKLQGTLAMAFSYGSEIDAPKVLKGVAEKTGISMKFGLLGKNFVGEAELKALADLPPKEILVAQLLGMLKTPATGLVNVLSAPVRGLAIALNAIATKQN